MTARRSVGGFHRWRGALRLEARRPPLRRLARGGTPWTMYIVRSGSRAEALRAVPRVAPRADSGGEVTLERPRLALQPRREQLRPERRPQEAARAKPERRVQAWGDLAVDRKPVGRRRAERDAPSEPRWVESFGEAGEERFGACEVRDVIRSARLFLEIVELKRRAEGEAAVFRRRHEAVAAHGDIELLSRRGEAHLPAHGGKAGANRRAAARSPPSRWRVRRAALRRAHPGRLRCARSRPS